MPKSTFGTNLKLEKMGVWLLALCCLIPGIAMASTTGTAQVKEGILTLTEGPYRLSFIEKSAWTIRELYFENKLLLSPTGAFGTVANIKDFGWNGTAHGHEIVEKIELKIDDKSCPLKDGLNEQGRKFVLEKQSIIGPYRDFSTITFDGKTIHEDFRYEVIADDSKVNFMYAFMHCFTNNTDQWMAQLKDGSIEEGKFLDDNSFTLAKDIRWAAVYDSSETMGMVYVYPEAYTGKKPFANSFWNRPRDNKLYLRPELPAGVGKKFAFAVTLQAFDADASDWQQTAKKLIAGIEQTPST